MAPPQPRPVGLTGYSTLVMILRMRMRLRLSSALALRPEMTEFHICEIGIAVFQEVEERHHRGDELIRENVTAVYRFNDHDRMVHLDIYEQAKDSGRNVLPR